MKCVFPWQTIEGQKSGKRGRKVGVEERQGKRWWGLCLWHHKETIAHVWFAREHSSLRLMPSRQYLASRKPRTWSLTRTLIIEGWSSGTKPDWLWRCAIIMRVTLQEGSKYVLLMKGNVCLHQVKLQEWRNCSRSRKVKNNSICREAGDSIN